MKNKIVFIGNSIINGYPFSRGKGFVGQVRTAFRGEGVAVAADVINKGENGQTTKDLMQRFERDVLDHRPAVVFIMTGTNDFIFREASPEVAFENMEKMAVLARAAEIVPVYMTPLHVDAALAAEMWMVGMGIDYDDTNRQIDTLADSIRNSGCLFVDSGIAYKRYAQECDRSNIASYEDGVHPTADGYSFLAEITTDWILTHRTELRL